jgi:putative transposase
VLAELKARGLEGILIACVDGLKGFPEAIEARNYCCNSFSDV